MAGPKKQGIDPELTKAISKLLKMVMADPTASITDRVKIIDRALKLEIVKQKMSDDSYGSGFFTDDKEE